MIRWHHLHCQIRPRNRQMPLLRILDSQRLNLQPKTLVQARSTNQVILTRLRTSWIRQRTHLALTTHDLSTITQAQSMVAFQVLIRTKHNRDNLIKMFQRLMVGHSVCHAREFRSSILRGLLTKVERKLLLRRQLNTKKIPPLGSKAFITQWGRSYIATAIEWTCAIITILTLRRSCLVQGTMPTLKVLERVKYHQLWARLNSFRFHKPRIGLSHRQWSNIMLAQALTHLRLR